MSCSASKSTSTKRTGFRISKRARDSFTTTTGTSAPQETSGSRRHPHRCSVATSGEKLAPQPQNVWGARAASATTAVAPEDVQAVYATFAAGGRSPDSRRSPSAGQSSSAPMAAAKENSSAMSLPLPLSTGILASSSCLVTSRETGGPSPGSPRASSTYDAHGDMAQLYLSPITASLCATSHHAVFTGPHFSGRSASWRSGTAVDAAVSSAHRHARDSSGADSGTVDTDGSSSYRASQSQANALMDTWVHSPLRVAQQRGAETRPRPSFASEPTVGASKGFGAPGGVNYAGLARRSPASSGSSTHFPPVSTQHMPVLVVPSVKSVSAARELLTPLPLVHPQRRSLLAAKDGQRGGWTLSSSWAPAGSPVSFSARSPSITSTSRPSSRSDCNSSIARSDGSRRAVAFQLSETIQEKGTITTTPKRQPEKSGEDNASPQNRQRFGLRHCSPSMSICSLSIGSAAASIMDEVPPPPPPPPTQLPLGRGIKTRGGGSLLLPPRESVPLSRLPHHLDSLGSSIFNASTASGCRSSFASSTLWESTGRMKSFMLSPVKSPLRSPSGNLSIPSETIAGTSRNGIISSEANELPSYSDARQSGAASQAQLFHYPSSVISLQTSLVSVPNTVNPDDVEEDMVGLRQAVVPLPLLTNHPPATALVVASVASSSVENDKHEAGVDELADARPLAIAIISDAIGKPAQSSELSTPQLSPSSVGGKTTQSVDKLKSNEDLNSKPRSGGAFGNTKAQLTTTFVQGPSLVSTEVPSHGRLSKAQALSPRQEELARSFRDRIQVGVRAPRRQRTAQRVSSASRDRYRASNDTSHGSRAEGRGNTRRRESRLRHVKGQTAQQPAAALPFIAVAAAAVAYAKLLRPVHALRLRRRFDEVIAPVAAYRIQCKWRRYLQLRRVEQKMAVQLLVAWMRFRLQLLRRAKDASARLLQRVFRGELVRSLHRYLYEQMKRNRALDVIRYYVQRWEAQKLYRVLQMQRDERALVVNQCVQGNMQLCRAEQVEWNAIVQDGAEILQSRPCVSTQDWVEGVAALTGIVLDPRASNFIRSSVANSAASTRARPTTMAQLRECLAAFARLEHQLFRSSDTKEDKTASSRKGSAPSSAAPSPPLQPTLALAMRATKSTQGERKDGFAKAHDDAHNPSYTAMSIASDGAPDSPTPSNPTATDDDFFAAYVQLLCRVEATERVELERRLLGEHHELLRKQLLLDKAILYATSMRVAPLFSPLLLDMPSEAVLIQAVRLFKEEREARCAIIQLYESMPLACLRRPMLNPVAKVRYSDLVRLSNGVDDPWEDAGRSEQRFYRETVAYKCLASSMSKLESSCALSYTPRPSLAPLGADDPDSVPSSRLMSPSHEATHNGGGGHLSIPVVPPLLSVQRQASYGTLSGLRVRMRVTAPLPLHVTSLFPSPKLAESVAPGGGGVTRMNENGHHANSFRASSHHGRGDVQSKTAIPSPHRRPRGPPLPLLRKLLRHSGCARSGTSRPSFQSPPVITNPALNSREGASESRPPCLNTYPNPTHFQLTTIRNPSTEEEGCGTEVGVEGSAQRSTNASSTNAACGSNANQDNCSSNIISRDADAGVVLQLPSPASAARQRFTAAAHATAAAASHFSSPCKSSTRVSVTVSSYSKGNVTEGLTASDEESAALLDRADLVDRILTTQPVGETGSGSIFSAAKVVPRLTVWHATAAPLESLAPSSMLPEMPLCLCQQIRTSMPMRFDKDASDAAALLSIPPPVLFSPAGVSAFQMSTTTEAAAQASTSLGSCRVKAVDFPPSPTLSSSVLTVAKTGADGWSRTALAPQPRPPPTPPPRRCYAAPHIGEASE
ncbi:hypothetical protein LPMP_180970 [Leishmania panamensis]|uniref:Uncharacterized protein n=1 Tax=Leishmania panamensis TaxID=5679 RepID=A0A088RMY4_LEIPA|nr:hypothetical protein LPMP_180970 [Leishmania panamensis]AIN97278.1 hypothetical protein LPMP_180970 [Leishmania panamensis]